MHAFKVPVMGAGEGFTVTIAVLLQPVAFNTKVIVAVPAATPVTTPLLVPIAAMVALLELQVPAPDALVNVVVSKGQTDKVPPMAAGNPLTDTVVTAVQPVDVSVNVIFEVPAPTPITTPVEELTVAAAVLLLAHVPAPDAFVNDNVVP
jgi:hypothetical protein